MPSGVASVLSVTLCSQLATLPVTIPAFETFSLIAPLANAVIGPVISVLLAVSVVLVPCSLVPLLRHGALVVPMIVARCALFFEQLFAAVPGASVSVPPDTPLVYVVPFALVALLVWWPRPRARSMAAGLLCLMLAAGVPYVYWDRCAPPSVTVLDVGQADAILVRQGGAVALVDCGLDDRVVSALVRNNVHHIDAVFVTHWDEDHWGGLPDVLDRFSVGTISVAADALDGAPTEVLNRPGVTYRQVARGDTVDIGAFRARVMWPFDTVDGEGNEDSLVLLLSYAQEGKSLRVLLTGDAELDQEREFVQEVGDIDVLKLGHHAQKFPSTQTCWARLSPSSLSRAPARGIVTAIRRMPASMQLRKRVVRSHAPSNTATLPSRRLRRALPCDASDRDDIVGARWTPGLKWHGTNSSVCERGAQCPKPVCCRHI